MNSRSIVLDTCMAHQVTPEEFFDRNTYRQDVVACRLYAIARLRAAEFNSGPQGRSMDRGEVK